MLAFSIVCLQASVICTITVLSVGTAGAYQQDKANKTLLYKPGPGLPDNIISLIKPINGVTDALLSKCLDGKTSNQNKSLNGMIWNRLPKCTFVGATLRPF